MKRLAALVSVALAIGCNTATPEPTIDATTSDHAAVVADIAAARDSSRNLMVINDRCNVPDPAIDAASHFAFAGSYPLVNEIHAGLTRIVEGPNDVPMVEMELAESFRWNADSTEIIFLLREDLTFSDGSPLTAEDVAWSWSRSLGLSEEWTAARRVFGGIVGLDQVIDSTTELLEGIKVIDANTLTVSFRSPSPRFHEMIAHPVASVLNKENVDNWPVAWDNQAIPPSPPTAEHPTSPNAMPAEFAEDTMPIGAGPFRLAGYEHSRFPSNCHLIANPHYFRGKPRLDAVIYRDLAVYRPPDDKRDDDGHVLGQDVGMFLEANLDLIERRSRTPEHIKEIGLESHSKLVTVSPPPLILYIALNADKPPLDDTELRKTIFTIMVNDGPFTELRSDSIMGLQSSNVDLVNEFVGFDDGEIDQDVRERLAIALASNDVKLHSSYSGAFSLLEHALSSLSEVAGVDVPIELMENEGDFRKLLEAGQIDMLPLPVNAAHPIHETVIESFGVAFGAVNESGEFADLREQLKHASTELDPVERRAKYADIERHALEKALVVPLFVGYLEDQVLLQPWVHGFNLKRFGGSAFHDVWFDDTAPERAIP